MYIIVPFSFFFLQTIPIAATLPKADRYIMQEIPHQTHLLNRKSYDYYVQHSIINAIIMSYQATLSYKLDSKYNQIIVK